MTKDVVNMSDLVFGMVKPVARAQARPAEPAKADPLDTLFDDASFGGDDKLALAAA